jgi:hypothetical protein
MASFEPMVIVELSFAASEMSRQNLSKTSAWPPVKGNTEVKTPLAKNLQAHSWLGNTLPTACRIC